MTLTEGPTDWEVDPWDSPAASGSVERLRRETRAVKWAVWTVMVVVVVLVLVAGRIGWWYVKQINPEGTPGAPVNFTVEEGDTLESAQRASGGGGDHRQRRRVPVVRRGEGRPRAHPRLLPAPPGDHIGNIVGTLRTPPAADLHQGHVPGGLHDRPDGQPPRRVEPSG